MEQHNMIVLSTAHVSEQTADALNQEGFPDIIHEKIRFGWLILYDDHYKEYGMPEDIYALMEVAQKYNARWIMLDRDASESHEIRTYDW